MKPTTRLWYIPIWVTLAIATAAVFTAGAEANPQLAVNFGATQLSGWDHDNGDAYTSARGYGWVNDALPSQCFDRSGSGPDDTLCRAESRYQSGVWQYHPAGWRADLPNGVYTVTVGWGDSAVNHQNRIVADGVTVVDGSNGKATRTSSAAVTVTDGTLDLTFGTSSSTRTALAWLTAELVSPATTSSSSSTSSVSTTAQPTTAAGGGGLGTLAAGVHQIDAPILIGTGDHLTGAGAGVTILRPSASFPAGQPLIRTVSLTGDGNGDFAISNLTVDCDNRCAGLRLHGYRFTVADVEVRDADGPGWHSTWVQEPFPQAPQGGAAMEAQIRNLRIQNSGSPTEPQMLIAGPNDSVFRDVFISTDAWHTDPAVPAAVRIEGQAFGTILDTLHYWGRGHNIGVDVAENVTGVRLVNLYAEGARNTEVLMRGVNRDSHVSGAIRCWGHDYAPPVQGLVLGPDTTGLRVDVQMTNCVNGGLVFNGANAGALSLIDMALWQSPVTGTAPASTTVRTVG